MTRVTYGHRLAALLERPLSDYDRGFIESLQAHYDRKRALTAGRIRALIRIEERYSDENLATGAKDPMLNRLAAIASRAPTGTWDEGFIESLTGQVKTGRSLSPRQLEILIQVEERHSEEAISAAQAWKQRYASDSELQLKAETIARYYTAVGYFKDLAENILNTSDFVPTQKQFEKITGNKYAQKVWAAWTDEAKYPVGSYVYLRTTAPGNIRREVGAKPSVVIEVNAAPPRTAAKGAKRYKVLPFGGARAVIVEERMLKQARGL